MKKISTLFLVLILSTDLFAQHNHLQSLPLMGSSDWAAQNHYQNPSLQNGNDTLNNVYSFTACGLDYTQTTVRLGQRNTVGGMTQPAPIVVSAITPCTTILKAFLYTEVLGVVPSINATLTDPNNISSTFPMINIGNSIDVCWGMNGTHVWRSDVTALITGSGTYQINGLPVSPTVQNPDAEGATLIIIYQDPTANWEGTIRIDDGCHTVASGPLLLIMTGLSPCSNSISARSFCIVGDIQMTGFTASLNGNASFPVTWNWWNYIEDAGVNISSSQSNSQYNFFSTGDCYTLAVAGIYYRTACMNCVPVVSGIILSTSVTAASCTSNGTANVSVTGNSGPPQYLWLPGGQTNATATGLSAGTYTVNVYDGNSCSSSAVIIVYTGPVLSLSSQPSTCTSTGSASVVVTGGVSPYSYLWTPSGGTNAMEINLISGQYTVTVTDNAGCSVTDSVIVTNNNNLTAVANSTPYFCPSQQGTSVVTVSGGTQPYSYSWLPGGQTTDSIGGLSPGIYTVIVTDAAGCSIGTIDTIVSQQITLSLYATPNTIYCSGFSLLIASTNANPASFLWQPGNSVSNPSIAMPYATPLSTTTYTLTLTTGCGTFSDTVIIFVDSLNYYAQNICFVTVDTALNKNMVIWERYNSPLNGSYRIYKETSPNVYTPIATQPIQQYSTYIDMASNPSFAADRYKLSTIDTCGVESVLSPNHRTIFLSVTGTGNIMNLSWNAYEGLNVTTYDIYRGPAMNQLSFLDTSIVMSYVDSNAPSGPLFYMIEARNPYGSCSPSFRDYDSTFSNLAAPNVNGVFPDGYQTGFHLFPNPSTGDFYILPANQNGPISVIIMDLYGRVIRNEEQLRPKNGLVEVMNGTIQNGTYLVHIKQNGEETVRKVIISK